LTYHASTVRLASELRSHLLGRVQGRDLAGQVGLDVGRCPDALGLTGPALPAQPGGLESGGTEMSNAFIACKKVSELPQSRVKSLQGHYVIVRAADSLKPPVGAVPNPELEG
jgi:hypothetical protein